jgi:hypothetical protein
MIYNIVIPFTTKKGNEYLIKFDEFHHFHHFSKPIIDIALVLVNNKANANTIGDLLQISSIIKNYIQDNDVILYYYCDHHSIERRKTEYTPQQFRFQLFNAMFKRINHSNFIKKDIIIEDKINGNHYISLISNIRNSEVLNDVFIEIEKLNQK